MGLFEVVDREVCVDLCGLQILVPQQFLDATQIRSTFDQVGGKAVPHIMGGMGRVQASPHQAALEEFPQRIGGHRPAADGEEEPG